MKFKRTERIGAIVKILSDNPNKIFTLSYFTEKFNFIVQIYNIEAPLSSV